MFGVGSSFLLPFVCFFCYVMLSWLLLVDDDAPSHPLCLRHTPVEIECKENLYSNSKNEIERKTHTSNEICERNYTEMCVMTQQNMKYHRKTRKKGSCVRAHEMRKNKHSQQHHSTRRHSSSSSLQWRHPEVEK